MESIQQHSLSLERQGEISGGDCDLTRDTRISDSGVESLEEKRSPTESLISQDTLDYIFQGFDTSGRRDLTDLTPDSETQSIVSDKKTLSGSTSSLRDTSRNLFQRLGALYSDNQLLSSPIHRTEGRFYEEMNGQMASTHSTVRLDKLSALADSISSWEDELPPQTARAVTRDVKITPKKYPAPPPPPQTVAEDENFIRKPSVKKTRAPDIPKLPPRGVQPAKENVPIAGMKDPAEMSLKERLALFEHNHPEKNGPEVPSSKPPLPKKPQNISSGGIRDKIATLFSSNMENIGQQRQREVMNRKGESVLRPLLPPPAVPSPGKRKSGELENIEMVAIVEEPKRPKTIQMDNSAAQNRPMEGNQVYPRRAISYDEDSSIGKSEEASFSGNGEERAEKSTPNSVLKSLLDRASIFVDNESEGSGSDLSGLLEDETLPISSEEENRDKGSISSDSFLYRRTPVKPTISMITEEGLNADSSDSESPLLHSVSFYRKQQSRSQSKCHKMITPQCEESQVIATETDDRKEMEEKSRKLNQEIHKQQQIISQTSQALNLCAATVEFCGSSEAVEGERHLLVATHRRLGALNELQRLNVERSLRPRDSPPERGSLNITGITLPLAQSYIRQMATDTIPGHHLVCLLKYNDTVLATQSIVTLPGLVAVKFTDDLHLPEVYADFRVTLEVYGMVAQREVLPHEIKYHIMGKGLPSSGKKFTPVKRLRKPIVESPAGPSAVRSPAFLPYGFVIFSLKESQKRNTWVLNRSSMTPDPLEGVVHMKVSCQLRNTVDHRGFLTMFDDVSGLGAWHRRWCHLQGTTLNYWKYPDDEMKKTPIGTIDLQLCKSSNIGAVPRDICARLNTILLELERPSMERDMESLVLIRRGQKTVVRHLLSTDTRDDREEWCRNLNHVLKLIKCWGSPE